MSLISSVALALSAILAIPGAIFAQGTIDGRIKTEDGRRPEHARVYLLDNMYAEKQMQFVSADGHFVFKFGSRENYYVKVDAGELGYEPQTVLVQTGNSPYGGYEVIPVNILLKLREVGKEGRAGVPSGARGGGLTFAQPVPGPAREAYDKASKSLEKNDAAAAVKELKNALDAFPDYFDALEALGMELVRQRDFPAALPVLRHAVQVNDKAWRSHYALGVALVESQQRAEGLSELRRSIEINPDSLNTHMRLGLELGKDPNTQGDGIKELEKVKSLAGKNVPADTYFYLASLYSKQKQYKEAADALESYLAAVPQADEAQKAQYRKAIQQLREKAKSK